MTVTGVVLGIGGALVTGRLLSTLLFGVSDRDGMTLALSAAGLGSVALIASFVPAYRAAKTAAATALGYD